MLSIGQDSRNYCGNLNERNASSEKALCSTVFVHHGEDFSIQQVSF